MQIELAQRLKTLPPYLFVEIDRKKRAAIEAGRDVIDFGVGDPDLPTPDFIIKRLQQAAQNPAHHRYPSGVGSLSFRRAVAEFFQKRYGVSLDPSSEINAVIGSKEGIGHLPLAIVNPGDVTLVPDPAYPVYLSGTIFAGGTPHIMPLLPERDWLPDLGAIPADVARRAKLMFVNYPNNPTGAFGSRQFLAEAVAFCRKHDILLVSDAAYNEMAFDEREAPGSVLEIPGGKEVAIEFHSLSKTFNMTGWRIGFVAGHREALSALARVKANLDSGQFTAIQEAAEEAYAGISRTEVLRDRQTYAERSQTLARGLSELGFRVQPPRATFYVWAGTPGGVDGLDVVNKLLDEAAIVCIPGAGFGEHGRNYVRFALTVDIERVRLALGRMRELRW